MMSSVSVEKLILSNLVKSDGFVRQCIPYLRQEYFLDKVEAAIFSVIDNYFRRTNTLPQKSILLVEIEEQALNDKEIDASKELIDDIYQIETIQDQKWLAEQTEGFCQEKSLYLSILTAIKVYDGSDKTISPHAIPDIIRDALSINFETRIGQDWFDDADERWERYINPEEKIPFCLESLNDITINGVARKTLNIVLGGVHVGKSMVLVHLACDYLRLGYNVLYITLEMGEDAIMQRVDANLTNVAIHKIQTLGKHSFMNRVTLLKQKHNGVIKVKEFPTSSASVHHFKHILNELAIKKRWTPQVIMVDYIGITASSKIKVGTNINSHYYLKSVAEELRALGIETNTVIWSAMQLNRGGMESSEIEMTDIAESIGIPAVSDLMFAVSRNEELDNMGQVAIKQLKNRFRDKGYKSRFLLGCDREKQLLFDLSGDAQTLSNENVEIDMNAIENRYKSSASRRFGNRHLNEIDMGE